MKTISVTWTGYRPLIMHNGRLADGFDPIVKRIKELQSKRAKNLTDAEIELRDRLEYEGSLYYNEKIGPYIPSDNIERCIQLGGQKTKVGKLIQAAVFCAEGCTEVALEYEGPRKLDALYSDSRFTIRKGVRVGPARIMRTRPMFPTGWKLNFDLEYDPSVVDLKQIVQAMDNAGGLVGLGDWRPKFGRFGSEVGK